LKTQQSCFPVIHDHTDAAIFLTTGQRTSQFLFIVHEERTKIQLHSSIFLEMNYNKSCSLLCKPKTLGVRLTCTCPQQRDDAHRRLKVDQNPRSGNPKRDFKIFEPAHQDQRDEMDSGTEQRLTNLSFSHKSHIGKVQNNPIRESL
jgi:hypothetical protein